MAIQNDLQMTPLGVPFKNSYIRIVTVAVSRGREGVFNVMIDAVPYATVPTDDTQGVDFFRLYAPLADIEACAGQGLLAQSYIWLMSHPDFAGSVAV